MKQWAWQTHGWESGEQSEVVTSTIQIGHNRGVNPDQTLSIYSYLFDFGLTNSLISDFRSDMLT